MNYAEILGSPLAVALLRSILVGVRARLVAVSVASPPVNDNARSS